MQILVVELERRPELKEIDGSLEAMQGIVGGLIQPIYPFDDPVALACNDEGKLMNLSPNRGLWDKTGQIYDIVCGTFFLYGAPPDSDQFTSLTPEQIKWYEERFHTPNVIILTPEKTPALLFTNRSHFPLVNLHKARYGKTAGTRSFRVSPLFIFQKLPNSPCNFCRHRLKSSLETQKRQAARCYQHPAALYE